MNTVNMPEFTAEATLHNSGKQYLMATRSSKDQGVIAQSSKTCAFKAGRLAGRCLQLGYDHQDCMEVAADFYDFCNTHGL